MPAVRTSTQYPTSKVLKAFNWSERVKRQSLSAEPQGEDHTPEMDLAEPQPEGISFPPPDSSARATFKAASGKLLTPHQWEVYDYVKTIPKGKVVTYKNVASALQSGSPRSVGTALRNNPFAPLVPCHRVIASNNYIGGFYGEWGPESKTGTKYHQKLDMLREEGVQFDERGFLVNRSDIWRSDA
ncbi:hypothetical protein FRB99_006132 [Tulasnella sp. 403]|nr:hypothetical protein FRB99_006132 [Tulasnella sp. 403]